MLEIASIRENKDSIVARLKKRGQDFNDEIDKAIQLDDQRRKVQKELDDKQAEANRISKEIGQLFKEGKRDEAEKAKSRTGEIKEETHKLREEMHAMEQELGEVLYHIPNVPHESVPEGNSDEDNEEISTWGSAEKMDEGKSSPHWDLASKFNLIDFELGTKITGAGFPVYRDKGAQLQRALIRFFLDEAIDAGYEEVIPPLFVNEASGVGTGQLPDKEGQMYHIQNDDLYPIPTAEVPITNIYRDVILDEESFPIKHCGYTPCFRREAGSYGKHVRGLNRLHQFDKVEVVQIAHPDHSYDILEEMTAHAEGLLKKLELPFRRLRLCGGDLGFAAALTYDLEVFSPAQDRWLEVSSISNFETFQANRLKCRYRPKGEKKTHLVHTLNGSALALPRVLAALLENNQDGDQIHMPRALHPYLRFKSISV